MVGAVGLFEFPSAVFLVQTASGLFVPGGNGQECHYILLKFIPVVEQGKAVDKEVDAFVLEFVTAAVDQKDGVVFYGLPGNLRGYFAEFGAGGFPFGFKIVFLRHEMFIEAVGGQHVYWLFEESFAFFVRDLAHGGEAVGMLGGELFQRIFGADAETVGELVRVVFLEFAVEGKPIAGDAAA